VLVSILLLYLARTDKMLLDFVGNQTWETFMIVLTNKIIYMSRGMLPWFGYHHNLYNHHGFFRLCIQYSATFFLLINIRNLLFHCFFSDYSIHAVGYLTRFTISCNCYVNISFSFHIR